MSEPVCPILGWNPRGLNSAARREVVAEMASLANASILCVQETKLASISDSDAIAIAGPSRRNFFFLPALGTRGGIAIFWNASLVSLSDCVLRMFSVSATVTILRKGTSFLLSTVYGPAEDELKPAFLQEMRSL